MQNNKLIPLELSMLIVKPAVGDVIKLKDGQNVVELKETGVSHFENNEEAAKNYEVVSYAYREGTPEASEHAVDIIINNGNKFKKVKILPTATAPNLYKAWKPNYEYMLNKFVAESGSAEYASKGTTHMCLGQMLNTLTKIFAETITEHCGKETVVVGDMVNIITKDLNHVCTGEVVYLSDAVVIVINDNCQEVAYHLDIYTYEKLEAEEENYESPYSELADNLQKVILTSEDIEGDTFKARRIANHITASGLFQYVEAD